MPTYAQYSQAARDAIRERRPFRTYGNLSGETNHNWYSGWLSGSARDAWHADRHEADYVVYSYGTPIAWHRPDTGWTYVDRAFSLSTRKAQSAVVAALGIQLWSGDLGGVRVLQKHYSVTPNQGAFLESLKYANEPLAGGAISTARALAKRGLVTYDENTRIATLTPAGRDQI